MTMMMGLHTLLPLMCAQYHVPIVCNISDQSSPTLAKTNPLPWHSKQLVRVIHGEDFLVALLCMEVGQDRTGLWRRAGWGERLNINIAGIIICAAKIFDNKEEKNVTKVTTDKDPTAPPMETSHLNPHRPESDPTTQQADAATTGPPTCKYVWFPSTSHFLLDLPLLHSSH